MNWDTVLVAFFTSIPPSILAAAALIQARKTHDAVNSRMSELLALARKGAADEATLAEKRAEHVRKGEAAVALTKVEVLP